MLQADKAHNAVALHEFDIECELLSRIDHPNIVQVLGSGTNPRPYIVLERLRDVSEVLDLNSNDETRPSIFHRRKFSYVEVLQLAKDLADAINYIHHEISPHAMIIHRYTSIHTHSPPHTHPLINPVIHPVIHAVTNPVNYVFTYSINILYQSTSSTHPSNPPYIHTLLTHSINPLYEFTFPCSHRDLKPENLGLTADRRLKLFDFGLCRCVKKRTAQVNTYKVSESISQSDPRSITSYNHCNTPFTNLTFPVTLSPLHYQMTGNTGSLRYMAPEVVLDLPYNETVDTFSFGIVVWTIAMNKLPFRGYVIIHHPSFIMHHALPGLLTHLLIALTHLLILIYRLFYILCHILCYSPLDHPLMLPSTPPSLHPLHTPSPSP